MGFYEVFLGYRGLFCLFLFMSVFERNVILEFISWREWYD